VQIWEKAMQSARKAETVEVRSRYLRDDLYESAEDLRRKADALERMATEKADKKLRESLVSVVANLRAQALKLDESGDDDPGPGDINF
jgi:hypothetical protein